jgi:hypothetical protein
MKELIKHRTIQIDLIILYFLCMIEGRVRPREPTVPWIPWNPWNLYKFNEIISGTLKNSEKEMGSLFFFGHFKNVQF